MPFTDGKKMKPHVNVKSEVLQSTVSPLIKSRCSDVMEDGACMWSPGIRGSVLHFPLQHLLFYTD